MANACMVNEPTLARDMLCAMERVAQLGGDLVALANEDVERWLADWDLCEFVCVRAAFAHEGDEV
jgi:hypothetical protein